MGCKGRKSYEHIRPEQKWDFISLNDFKCTSCFEPLAYGYLLYTLIASVTVYALDTFTAIQLLAFNHWSSQISPAISTDISKWIFAICIILSFVNLGYEYIRAIRVMKRGAVAESYLDSLAVRIQSTRMDRNGHGWRRFLVFAELTRSKKGAEYIALFTYFSFQAWIRIIFCSGPRQVVNALTLYSVYVAKLDVHQADVGSSILQFFRNIGILASENRIQAVILAFMLISLIIWAFAALSLLIALLFYVFFLWHYIPNSDGGLSGYCERKINGRLTRIVSAKVNKALEDEERKKYKDARKKGEAPILGRQATIPTLFDAKTEDSLPEMPMLHRNDTMTTLPVYTSRPGTPSTQVPPLPGSGFELSTLDQKRPYQQRSATESSALSSPSYSSNAPLLAGAGEMGFRRTASPADSLPPLDTEGFQYPQRSMTGSSSDNQWQRGTPQPSRQMTADSYSSSQRGPPIRLMTQDTYTSSPTAYSEADRNSPRPQGNSIDSYGRPLPRVVGELSGRSTPGGALMGRRSPYTEIGSSDRQSPAPSSEMGQSSPVPSMQRDQGLPATRGSNPGMRLQSNLNPGHSSNGSGSGGYTPYNPNTRSASAGIPSPAPTSRPQPPQFRNLTEPAPARQPPGDYFGDTVPPLRQGTPQRRRGPYNEQQYMAYQGPGNDMESQQGMPRSQSPAGWQAQQGGYQRQY